MDGLHTRALKGHRCGAVFFLLGGVAMSKWGGLIVLTFGALAATAVVAKVTPEEAAKLGIEGTELTPMGAIRAGNADGSIPAWDGGIKTPPAGYKEGGWYIDPYADDKPLFTITAQNYRQYADKLTTGQIAMMKKYPDTYKMNVYPSRRSASLPQWHYENSIWNATHAEWCNPSPGPNREKRCLQPGTWKPGTFFPIPKDNAEVMWNHTFRFIGKWYTATSYGFNAFPDGTYAEQVKLDRFLMPLWIGTFNGEEPLTQDRFTRLGGGGLCASQEDISPPRSAGGIFSACLYLGNTDFDAYVYVPGQRRVRKAPEIGFYDSPGTGSDGLRTADSRWMYWLTGSEEWYDFAPVQRKEIFIPYNSYKIAQPGLTFHDIVLKGHVNSDLKRYELHRVWVVEATLKPGTSHIYSKRVFYLDEDSWIIAATDKYDGRGELWRYAEQHNENWYNIPMFFGTLEVHNDLQSGRYIAMGLRSEEKLIYEPLKRTAGDYTPSNLRGVGTR